jgi:hypothetical protein
VHCEVDVVLLLQRLVPGRRRLLAAGHTDEADEPFVACFDQRFERTGCVVVVVGGTSIVADPGASARLAPDDLPASLEAGAVLVSGYSLLQPGAGSRGARSARARTNGR